MPAFHVAVDPDGTTIDAGKEAANSRFRGIPITWPMVEVFAAWNGLLAES